MPFARIMSPVADDKFRIRIGGGIASTAVKSPATVLPS
jgi:hypothetical protein